MEKDSHGFLGWKCGSDCTVVGGDVDCWLRCFLSSRDSGWFVCAVNHCEVGLREKYWRWIAVVIVFLSVAIVLLRWSSCLPQSGGWLEMEGHVKH